MCERAQSTGEEIANSVSHGAALVAAAVAAPFPIIAAARGGTAADIAGAGVLDHGAIYLLIAGTYTPFTLGALGGPWGWTLFGVVWSLAVVGVALKAFDRMAHPAWSTGLYLAMGWSVLFALGPLIERVATGGLVLLAGGGLAYTAGVVFFTLDSRLRYGHFVWHLFVVAGTACHYFAVLGYAA